MQNFEKILTHPLQNFLDIEQKCTNIEQEIAPKFFKDLKSHFAKSSNVR